VSMGKRVVERSQQALILGVVVGLVAEILMQGGNLLPGAIGNDDPIARRPWIAARPAVDVRNELRIRSDLRWEKAAGGRTPLSVKRRIRRHSKSVQRDQDFA
jgi:hypothetical protein